MSTILRTYKYLSFFNSKSKLLSKQLYSIHSSFTLPIVSARDNVAFKLKASMQFRPYSVSTEEIELDSSIPLRQYTESTDTTQLNYKLSKLDSDARSIGRLYQREVKQIITLVKSLGNVSSTQGLLLIKACGSLLPEMSKKDRRLLVEDVWNTLLRLKCSLDVSHYNALLKVYLDNENQLDPIEFLSMMQRNGIEPNRVIYQRLVSHYCQNGDVNGASNILKFMKLKDFPMNEYIFNDLIMGNVRANNVEDGKNIIGVMRDAKLPITSSTYTSLACGYATLGDITNVLATVQEATTEDAPLLDRDILNIIYTLTVSNHEHLVEQVLPLIQCKPGYTPDCIVTILELINKGFHKVAFDLLKTMPGARLTDGSVGPSGMFFIRQLVKQDVDPDVIIDYCNQLKTMGLNEHALFKAIEMALYFKKSDAAITFIKEMHSKGEEIRPHFFWPVLACKRGSEKEIYDILKLMLDLNCPGDGDTFTAHVFPYVSISDIDSLINKLKAIGYEKDFVQSLILFLIENGDLRRTAKLLEKHATEITPLVKLSKAFMKSQDPISTVQILQKFHDCFSATTVVNKYNNVYGEFLYHFAVSNYFSSSLLEKLLLVFEEKDLKIDMSHTTLEIISRKLDADSRANITNLLKKLTTSDSVLELLKRSPDTQMRGNTSSITSERMLLHHASRKNLTEVQEILKELDEQDFSYTGRHFAALIELYNFHGDLDKALYYKGLLDQQFSDFPLKEHTIINLAVTLVQNKKIDDAENLLLSHYTKHGCKEEANSIVRNVLKLLNSLADSEEPQRTKTFFESLLSYGFCKPERVLLRPLIQAHLANNQISQAVEEFIRCVKTYKSAPSSVELFSQLILRKDTQNLQRVTDAAITIHGEANVLLELAMAFIDCGQLEQAKKVAETSGLRVRMERMDDICEFYCSRRKIKELESFLQVTKNVFGLNRDSMYRHLLKAYVNDDNVEKALSVWEKMQEEDTKPSDQTLHLLGTFLQRMNQPVPFTIPDLPPVTGIEHTNQQAKMEDTLSVGQRVKLDNRSSSVTETSQTIRALLDKDHLEEALKLSEHLFESGLSPNSDVSRFLALKLAKARDKDSLLKLQEKLPEDIVKRIPFKNYIAEAYINLGQADEFLRSLENEVFKYKEDFPGGALLHLLSVQPETLERVRKLVDVYYQEGLAHPRNLLWIHLMRTHDFEEAKKVFEATPEMKSALLFKSLLKSVSENSDVELSEKLLDQAKQSTLTKAANQLIYLNHVTLLLAMKKVDEALTTFRELLSIVNLDELNHTTRTYILSKFKLAGVATPFVIPQSLEDSSSSSSSDDEKK